jgi:hypothetical protein
MGKDKVEKIVVSSTPPLTNFGSFVVVTTSSLRELVAIDVAYTSENSWKTLTSTSTNLSLSRSYVTLKL